MGACPPQARRRAPGPRAPPRSPREAADTHRSLAGLLARTNALMGLAETLDAIFDEIAWAQIDGRLVSHPDAGRRAGAEDVPGQQGHEPRHVAHQCRDVEDQARRVAVLFGLAVDLEPQARRPEVWKLLAGHQRWAERREAVGALPLGPLAEPFELERALRIVVVQDEARHVVQRRLELDIFGALADHQRQLHLPVGLVATLREHQVVVRSGDRARRLEEDDRFAGEGGAAFARVVAIVEADADQLRRSRDRGSETRPLGHAGGARAFGGQPAAETGEPVAREEPFIPVAPVRPT